MAGWLRNSVAVVTATVLLGACAHSRPSAEPGATRSPATAGIATSASAAPSTPATAQPHQEHRPYSDQNLPPRRAGNFVVTVLSLTIEPAPGHESVRPSHAKWQTWAAEVRTCVTRTSHHTETVGWQDWRAQGIRGHLYAAAPGHAVRSWAPAYPLHKVLAPGQCATGYWQINAPNRTIRAIQFAPHGGPTLIEWLTEL